VSLYEVVRVLMVLATIAGVALALYALGITRGRGD
jgi:hypothetical protein